MYEKLFEPIKIGSMDLKNRLFVPAMSTLTATPEGASTEQFIAYLSARRRAAGALSSPSISVLRPMSAFSRACSASGTTS